MEYKIEFVYSPEIYRATRSIWLREFLAGRLFYLAIPLSALAMCILSGEFMSSRTGALLVGVLLGVSSTLLFQFCHQLSHGLKSFLKSAEKWHGTVVVYQFNDAGIFFRSDHSATEFAWRAVEKLHLYPRLWTLVTVGRGRIALPAASLSEELQQFIISKVREAGGKVVR